MAEGGAQFWRIVGLLEHARKSGSGWESRCPAHEDKHASLSVGLGYDGRVLLNCHAGCDTTAILSALHLDWGDLFEKNEQGHRVRRFRLLDSSGNVVAQHIREDVGDDKKLWWEHAGRRGLNGTAVKDLPLYRLPDLLAAKPGSIVILTEGEKAAEALAEIGLLAVATVTGAGTTPSDTALEPLQNYEVWLWPDNDQPGRQHMLHIGARLRSKVRWIDWPDAPEHGDAADFLDAGGKADQIRGFLRPEATTTTTVSGPRIWQGDQLAVATFDPVRWAIPGILPSGLTILAGRPKLGKSWMCLGWCLDVASGRPVFKKIVADQGKTLYLALEDNERRMQERQAMMLGDVAPSPLFNVATEWPRLNEGGLDLLEQWAEQNPDARLIGIDTFKRFRPKEGKSQRLYDLDYDAIAPLHALASNRNIAIVLVFHTNKLDPADPIDLVSGTLGVSGASDGVLVLKRERGQADASLFVTGRDVEEQDLALKWHTDDTYGWELLGNSDQFKLSRERQRISDVVSANAGMKPAEIAAAAQMKAPNVRFLLFAMVRDGQVRSRDGLYYPALDHTANTANATNAPNTAIALAPSPIANAPVSDVSAISAVSSISAVSGVSGLVEEVCPVHGLGWADHDCDALAGGDDVA